MLKLNSIEQEWQKLASMIMPTMTASDVQYQEMRKAFFAGACFLYANMCRVGEADVSEAAGCAYLDGVKEELAAFMREVKTEVTDAIRRN